MFFIYFLGRKIEFRKKDCSISLAFRDEQIGQLMYFSLKDVVNGEGGGLREKSLIEDFLSR